MSDKGRRVILFVLAAIIVLSSMTLLCACDKTSQDDAEYGLYLKRIDYDEETLTMTAIVALTSAEDGALDGVKAGWHWEKYAIDSFYNGYEYRINLNPSAIFSAVDASLTQEQRKKDEVEFVVLKVAFEYATIYKSMTGSGTRVKSGKYFLHDFALDESQTDATVNLALRTHNSATWYGVLIAVTVALFAGVLLIVFARRKKYAKEQRTENQ